MYDNAVHNYLKSLKKTMAQKPLPPPQKPPARPPIRPQEVPIRKAAPAPSVPLREAPEKAGPPHPPPNR